MYFPRWCSSAALYGRFRNIGHLFYRWSMLLTINVGVKMKKKRFNSQSDKCKIMKVGFPSLFTLFSCLTGWALRHKADHRKTFFVSPHLLFTLFCSLYRPQPFTSTISLSLSVSLYLRLLSPSLHLLLSLTSVPHFPLPALPLFSLSFSHSPTLVHSTSPFL